MEKFSEDFLAELFAEMLKNQKLMDVCSLYLKYQHLPHEAYKELWKQIYTYYDLYSSLPTIGYLGQVVEGQTNEMALLSKIKNVKVRENKDSLFSQLEDWIKRQKFIDAFNKSKDLFNEGKEHEAYKLHEEKAQEISNFTIKEGTFQQVFQDYPKRFELRKQKDREKIVKCPTGIHELDHYIRGGIQKGTSFLALARSGVGKSTYLRWVALSNAFMGNRVLHIQLEGSEEEALEAYDAGWTSKNLIDIEFGNISSMAQSKIEKARKEAIAEGGDIIVKGFEQFNAATTEDIRSVYQEVERIYGKPDLVIVDYLELLSIKGLRETGSNDNERKKRESVANHLTNLAVENNIAMLTVTQANDIKPEKWDNPDRHMTRSDISEFKGLIKPFSYFITLNQTNDEYEKGIMRLYCDKFRKYKAGQLIKIFQNIEKSRFYDPKRTLQYFWDSQENKKIKRNFDSE